MSCRVCVQDPKARKAWGCDEELSPNEATNSILCTACAGVREFVFGDERVPCPECKGEGFIPLLRCPNIMLDDPQLRLFLSAYNLVSCGILPVPGGLLVQTNWFLEACRFMTGCLSEIKD